MPTLHVFGSRTASFPVGGGILILKMAIDMFYAEPGSGVSRERAPVTGKRDLAVVPLAVPLIAGPAAISSVIVYAQLGRPGSIQLSSPSRFCWSAACLWVALRLASPISATLGRNGINVITHLSAPLLAAIAVEFVINGLTQLLER
jgi:multiple antibiotic resistance protein